MLLQLWWSKDVSTAEYEEVTAYIKNLTTTKIS